MPATRKFLMMPVKSYAAVAESLSAKHGRKFTAAEIQRIERRALLNAKDALDRKGLSFGALLALLRGESDS